MFGLKRKLLLTVLVSVVILVAVCAGLLAWVRQRTTYYVAGYRNTAVVETDSLEQIRDRFYPVEFDSCTINLEWNTYDNADITSGPYKLLVVVVPKTDHLQRVTIRSLDLLSSEGTDYETATNGNPVVEIDIEGSNERFSGKTTQAFNFDFDAGEEISTTMFIDFDLGDTIQTEEIKLEWKPILIRFWSSIV